MSILDGKKIEIVCPACGQSIQANLGWLKNKDCACPNCRAALDTDQAAREIRKLEKSLAELGAKGSVEVSIKL